jgi:glycosyltransferase involved in cell wall biosynthesis
MNSSAPRIAPVVIAITLAKPGGATSFVLGLARFLKQQGRSVTVLAGEGDWLFVECAKSQIPCLRIPSLGRALSPLRDLKSLVELTRLLRRLRPEALHLNSSKMGVLGGLAGRLARIPRIIYCIGGWSFLESLPEHTRRFYTWAERISAPFKDVIVCVHPGDAEEATRLNIRGREETRVIPNGVDLSTLDQHRLSREEARQLLGLPRDGYIFGTIGNFYPAKDLPRYLEACALVRKQLPNVHFAFIGDGPERPTIEIARKTHALEDVVHLLGSREEASRYLLAFDSFVFPSAKEGMAFALLEAMAAALPCIVTDVGANRWMIGTTGWIVPAKDPSRLAEAMKGVYSNRLQATEQGLQGRGEVETRFPVTETLTAHDRLLFPTQ